MNILLAEDEKDLSRALSAILNHNKYNVTAVYNGRDAVDKALEGTFDCMIFDIMMPIMDGITALKKIREEGINTPVLFLTAKSEQFTIPPTISLFPISKPPKSSLFSWERVPPSP